MTDNTETGVFQKFFNFSLAEIIQDLLVLSPPLLLLDLLERLPVGRGGGQHLATAPGAPELTHQPSPPLPLLLPLPPGTALYAQLQLELPQQVLHLQRTHLVLSPLGLAGEAVQVRTTLLSHIITHLAVYCRPETLL